MGNSLILTHSNQFHSRLDSNLTMSAKYVLISSNGNTLSEKYIQFIGHSRAVFVGRDKYCVLHLAMPNQDGVMLAWEEDNPSEKFTMVLMVVEGFLHTLEVVLPNGQELTFVDENDINDDEYSYDEDTLHVTESESLGMGLEHIVF